VKEAPPSLAKDPWVDWQRPQRREARARGLEHRPGEQGVGGLDTWGNSRMLRAAVGHTSARSAIPPNCVGHIDRSMLAHLGCRDACG